MNSLSLVFYSFEFLAALSALLILFTRNVLHGALLLIVCLLSLACIYILATAEFVAVTQILVYAGGVLVLVIFGVMLTSKISGKPLVVENQSGIKGPLVGVIVFASLCYLFSQSTYFSSQLGQTDPANSFNKIGILIMSDYVLPFETAGVLLLVALIGAAVVASTISIEKK